jgi:hypothetical protein
MSGRLGAILDGRVLGDEEARAVWTRFSAYMDEHKGDLAGFAASEGLASVQPETRAGKAVLVLSHTASQQPYGEPSRRSGGGSGRPHDGGGRGPGHGGQPRHGGGPPKAKRGRP